MDALFEPMAMCPLPYLSTKVAFLLAITSARRVRKIQALVAEPPYMIIHKDEILKRPHVTFLSKVMLEFHIEAITYLCSSQTPCRESRTEITCPGRMEGLLVLS